MKRREFVRAALVTAGMFFGAPRGWEIVEEVAPACVAPASGYAPSILIVPPDLADVAIGIVEHVHGDGTATVRQFGPGDEH